jgi:signal transduction histidine kinase/BarA-like signal transduction histidine kinase
VAEPAIRVLLVDDDEDERVIIGDLLRPAGPDRFELSWAATYEQGMRAILASSCDVCLVDYRLGERSGLDLLVEVTAKPGHPEVILLTGEGDPDVDVTAAKSGAADYLLKAELTAAVLERSIRYAVERGRMLRDLRNATELAQSLNLAKSAFLSSMSHEIRTPMNAILGMSEMLWESALDAEQTQYLEVIRSAGSGLLVLINEILDLSKIEAGRLELERVAFDLEQVVDQAIDLVAVKARAKNTVLLSDVPAGTATRLIGDPNRLRQILVNLLGNAVKFTDSGKIVLTARNYEPGTSGLIEISVSDTGIGIPESKLETIFDDFTQAESSTTRNFGGTGLGLGISRRLVEAMGGRLVATSVEGQGSTFKFTAQFDPAEESSPLKPVETVTRRHSQTVEPARILIAEDFEDNCFLIRAYLKDMPYELTFEGNGKAVISRLARSDFDLILMDVQMPEMDGLTATRAIRALERAQKVRAIPIIAMTANASPQDVERSADAGCDAHLSKPVSRIELLRAIERYRRPAGVLVTEKEVEVLSR